MRTLRHHLLMEEDRKHSQGKERNNGNGNWHKKKQVQDLRDKINRKSAEMTVVEEIIIINLTGGFQIPQLRHFRAECTKKRRTDEKRNAGENDKDQGNSSPDGMSNIYVCTESLFSFDISNS